MAAIAAAAAVAAIVVATTMAANSGGPQTGPVSGLSAPAPPAPRYIASLVDAAHGGGLSIVSARTGKRVSFIAMPRGKTFITTVATAPGRFIVAAISSSARICASTWLYQVKLTRRGKPGRLALLPDGRIDGVLASPALGLAASAGGRVIAYAANHCDGKPGWLGVIRPATGQSRRWPLRSEGLFDLTLSPDGQVVYFDDTTSYGGDGTIRAMRTDAQAGPMLRRARIVLPASSGVDGGGITLAEHGRILLACRETQHTAVLTAYSAATGGELAVLHTWQHVDVGPCTLTAASSGGYLLITDIGTYPWRLRLGSRTARQLPIGTDKNPVDSVAW